MDALELSRRFAELAPEDKQELFRPYVWRDRARIGAARAAELAAADEAMGVCSCCGGPPWFCGVRTGPVPARGIP